MFVGLLVAGLVLRVLALRSTWGQPDADTAVSMQMVLRASEGHFSLLYWGQNYGGAGLAWIEAPLVWIFGMNTWPFYVVDIALMVVAACVLRAIGSRFLTRTAADVAAGTFFFFPAIWLFWSSRAYLFYVPAVLLALVTCLLILQWFETRDHRRLIAIGYCAGVAIWCFPLVFPLIGPPLAILFWVLRKDRRRVFTVAAAGFVGVAPWLAYFALHGRDALHRQAAVGSRLTALGHTVNEVLPTAFIGGEERFGVIWRVTSASPGRQALVGITIYAATVVFTVFAIRRREVALASCGVSVIIWPPILFLTNVPLGTDTNRYGVIVVAPLLLIAAHLLSKVHLVPVLAVVALASVTFTLWSNTDHFAKAPTCFEPLVETTDYLAARERTAVWSSYWLSGPLTLCSGDRVTAGSVIPRRDHSSETKAADAPKSTYVVFADRGLDNQLRAFAKTHPVKVTRSTPSDYAIWEFETAVQPEEIGLRSNF